MDYQVLEDKLASLEAKQAQGIEPDETDTHLVPEIVTAAQSLQLDGLYDKAITTLEQAIRIFPSHHDLKRSLALAYGGKAELFLSQSDRMGARPGDEQIEDLVADLSRAIALDPDLPDPHWDLAVIAARFQGDFHKAEQHLNSAKQMGYAHPLMQRLERLIREQHPPQTEEGSPVQNNLTALVLKLVEQARGPLADALDAEVGLGDVWCFNQYCEAAAQLVQDGTVSREDFLAAFQAVDSVGGDAGEYALDLMRRTADLFEDDALVQTATHAHLKILAQQSFAVRSQVDQRPKALRLARRCADRGLGIVQQSRFEVDPDIHADLLLAKGQTFAHPSEPRLDQALLLYLQALDLKIAAGNDQDVQRLQALIHQMCTYQITQARVADVIGGVGEALRTLKIAYEASERLDDSQLFIACGLSLAEAYGQVRQAVEAIDIVRQILDRGDLTPEQSFEARFILAARLSEAGDLHAGNVTEARQIGERLVRDMAEIQTTVPPHTVWMNLGNFRRLDQDLEGARDAFLAALDLCPATKPDEVPEQRGQIKALLAEAEILLGYQDVGRRLLAEAADDFKYVIGFSRIHFESLAAKYALFLRDAAGAVAHARQGFDAMRMMLEKGPAPDVWESVFREWTRLDVVAIKACHRLGGNTDLEKALVAAEAAKGRLVAWLVRARWDEAAAQRALDPERLEPALTRVCKWAKIGQRWVVSMFAHREGLSITAVSPTGSVMGKWLDDFDYDLLRLKIFEPWEESLSSALGGGDLLARKLAAPIVELLLERFGNLLCRAVPELAKGGDELVLLPHRLFRSLPITYALLPNGKRLTQLFDRVFVCPTLSDFADQTEHACKAVAPEESLSIVDADGSLPFARLEGMAAFGPDNLTAGDQVTIAALQAGFQMPGAMLLSCHGDFNETNPWRSVINAADGDLVLGELLKQGGAIHNQLIVLGVCEAGKSRRSLSDEPVSFPSLMLNMGAGLVIAPLWKVEDLSSFLFIGNFSRLLRNGHHPAQALADTATWMQTLTAKEALSRLEELRKTLDVGQGHFDPQTSDMIKHRIEEYTDWLAYGMAPNEYPFDALDWAAYQMIGYCSA